VAQAAEIEDDPLRLCHGDVFLAMGVAIRRFVPTPLRLVWNASASAPIGFYDLDRPRHRRSAIWSR
jgi:type IV secretory pathway protease TraF